MRVVEAKAALGLPLAVVSPNLKGVYGAAGERALCSDPSNKGSVRATSDASHGKEGTGSCVGIGAASVQERSGGRTGEGKQACKADGGRVADGS